MEQKTITTEKATLLVVEMPEGITEIGNTGKRISIPDRKGGHHFFEGNWQLLGRLPEINEGQAESIVPNDYHKHIRADARWYWALLFDFLKENEVCFENKELKWKTFDTKEKYKQAQSKVWDKERCYLFIKVD